MAWRRVDPWCGLGGVDVEVLGNDFQFVRESFFDAFCKCAHFQRWERWDHWAYRSSHERIQVGCGYVRSRSP